MKFYQPENDRRIFIRPLGVYVRFEMMQIIEDFVNDVLRKYGNVSVMDILEISTGTNNDTRYHLNKLGFEIVDGKFEFVLMPIQEGYVAEFMKDVHVIE